MTDAEHDTARLLRTVMNVEALSRGFVVQLQRYEDEMGDDPRARTLITAMYATMQRPPVCGSVAFIEATAANTARDLKLNSSPSYLSSDSGSGPSTGPAHINPTGRLP